MTTTLTDRYVHAALHSVPAQKRSDIDAELRASIADAIDARMSAGEDPSAAELAVLTELGDPARLAAGYAETPLHLIGPALYLDYIRLLRTLIVTVLPIVVIAVTAIEAVRDGAVGQIVGTAVSTMITVGVHLVFWTTLTFAVLERVPGVRTPLTGPWNPSMLPEPATPGQPSPAQRIGQVIALVVGSALFITAILLAPSLSPKQDAEGNAISILDPWLWDTGVVYVYIGLWVVALGITVSSLYTGKLTVVSTLAGIPASALLLSLAANDRVLNPAFAVVVGWAAGLTMWIHLGLVIAAALGIVVSIIEAIRIAWRRR